MNNNTIYTPSENKPYATNPFDRKDPALPDLPNEVVLNILKYLSPPEAHKFMTLCKSEMGVNRVEYHKNLLTYKTALTAKELHQYRMIFSIGSPQPKSWSEVCSDLTFSNITHLDLSNDKTLTDSDLNAILKGCPNLTSLNLNGCEKITDVSLKALADHYPNLIAIKLSGSATSTKEILSFAKSHPHLTAIYINRKDLTDEDIKQLSLFCPLLESITLCNSSLVGDIGIQELAKNCSNLRSIELISPNRIEALHLFRGGISDTGLIALATYSKKLTSVKLVWCKQITPAGIEHLLRSCPITSLELVECYQTNNPRIKSMASLCTNLTTLNLNTQEPMWDSANDLKDDGLAELAKYAKNLTSIDLTHKSRITINGIKELAKNCPNLVLVKQHSWGRIYDEQIKEFEKEFPKVKIETKL